MRTNVVGESKGGGDPARVRRDKRRAETSSRFRFAVAATYTWSVLLLLLYGGLETLGINGESRFEIVLFAITGGAGFWFWRQFPSEGEWDQLLSFGGSVLAAFWLNRIFYLLDLFVNRNDSFASWPVPFANAYFDTFLAEICTTVGTALVVLAWYVAGGGRYHLVKIAINFNTRHSKLTLLGVYVQGLIAAFMMPKDAAGSLSMFASTLAIAGSWSLMLLVWNHATSRRFAALAVVVALDSPFVARSMNSGMKEAIIVSAMPVLLVVSRLTESRVYRSLIAVALVGVVASVTSFTGYVRSQAWGSNKLAIGRVEAVQGYRDATRVAGVGSTLSLGVMAFLQRADAGMYRGWAVSVASTKGYQPGLVFGPLAYLYIPRWIWPEKPSNDQTREYTRLVFSENIDSSTSAGFFSGLFLGGGVVAVLVGAIAAGVFVASLGDVAWTQGGPVLYSLYSLSLIPFAFRLDETWVPGAFTSPLATLLYVAVSVRIARVLAFPFEQRARIATKKSQSLCANVT